MLRLGPHYASQPASRLSHPCMTRVLGLGERKGDPAAIGYYGFKDSVLKTNLRADRGRRYPTI